MGIQRVSNLIYTIDKQRFYKGAEHYYDPIRHFKSN